MVVTTSSCVGYAEVKNSKIVRRTVILSFLKSALMSKASKFIAIPEWFKLKRYPHIGLPIAPRQVAAVISYIKSPDKIAHHAFMPFIRREMISHPYRVNSDTGVKERKRKVRKLTYASHLDSAIFAYYALKLQKSYEVFVRKNHLENVAVAYRKIKCPNGGGNKCNIHIAGDVFQYVRSQLRKNKEVAIITFDIKEFFDSLDHKYLKQSWKKIMGCTDMPEDEYNILKHATKFSYIRENRIFEMFKDQILCESGSIVRTKRVKRLDYMRDKNAIAYCDRKNIDIIRQSGYIEGHKGNAGIPQGLPISAVLANIYMSSFDIEALAEVQSAGGIYKRYSDDIVVVCPIKEAVRLKNYIINHITSIHLEIQERKTNLYEIHKVFGKAMCFHEKDGMKHKIEYLGFSFDGEHVLIKSAGLSNYFHKMWRSKRRHKRWAISINNSTNGRIFEHPFYKRYTLAGSVRHQIRRKKGNRFVITGKKSYGNYLTYAYKASEVLGSPSIKRQLRKNLHRVRKSINEIRTDITRVQNAKMNATLQP